VHSFSFKFNVCNGILFGWCFNSSIYCRLSSCCYNKVIRATSSGDFLVYASDDIFAIVNNTLASRVIVLIKKIKSRRC